MKIFKYLIFLLVFLSVPAASFAANHYVRSGATGAGNGADWANAWTSLPTALVRGDTYYVGSGTYSGYTFDDPVSGSLYITIKKATTGDHGTDTGWQSSYATGQAVFGALTFGRGYFIFDGVTGGGPGSWTSGHGFKVNLTSGTAGNGITISTSSMIDPTNIEILHTEIAFAYNAGLPYPTTGTAARDAFYCQYGAKNVRIAYSKALYPGRTHFYISGEGTSTPPTGWVVEYSYFEKSGYTGFSPTDAHSEIVSVGYPNVNVSNMTWRYNYFLDWGSTGGLIMRGSSDWYIYGNIFRWSQNWGATSNNGVVGTLTAYSVANVYIYNNTFIDLAGGGSGKIFPNGLNSGLTGVVVRNNLWYNSPTASIGSGVTHDYNWFKGSNEAGISEANKQVGTGSPFVNLAAGDFSLIGPTNSGYALSTPYNKDMNGLNRGSDSVWDRGAYEYSSALTKVPKAPVSLMVD